MRMLEVVAVAFALGFALIIWQMLGVGALFAGGSNVDGGGIEGEVNSTVDQAEDEQIDPEENTGFFSYVGSAISTVLSLGAVLAYLPSALEGVGFHPVAAWVVGRAVQLVLVFGLLQIAIQFDIR